MAIRNELTGETYEKVMAKKPFRVVSDLKKLERGIVAVNENWEIEKLD
jgi:hypothetical protein